MRGENVWWVVTIVICLRTVVDCNRQQANDYKDFIDEVRRRLSHPYRWNTAVTTGAGGVLYLPLNRLSGENTVAEAILSPENLYLIGYRIRRGNQRIVYVFDDQAFVNRVNGDNNNNVNFNRLVRLNYGGSYIEMGRYAHTTREDLRVNAAALRDGIRLLDLEPNRETEQGRARILMTLAMVISEAARFNEIYGRIHQALLANTYWSASAREMTLMNEWSSLSTFIVDNTQRRFPSQLALPRLQDQALTLANALTLCAVILRCFAQIGRSRRDVTSDQCAAKGAAVDAAIADGVNNVYFFNGPNFVYVRFTPGTTDDRIVGGVRSIYDDWTFLRGTVFVNGLDAAFRVPKSSNAYIFKGDQYALIDVTKKRIINGPKTIWDSWPSLRPTAFVKGIDAAFHSIYPREVYLFRGDQYALVDYAPGSKNDRILNGPKSIYGSWPSLRNTAFVHGFDASFARPDKAEAYLFEADKYVLVNYAPRTTHDYIVNGPLKIRDGWPSLRNTAFDLGPSAPSTNNAVTNRPINHDELRKKM